MRLILKYLFVLLILSITVEVSGQDTKEPFKFSVSEAQSYALQNNRAVRSAVIDVNSADKKVWETVSAGLPQLNLSVNYQHQFVIPELSFGKYLDPGSLPAGFITRDDIIGAYKDSPAVPLGVRNNTTFDFTLSQLIFSGEYIVGLQATRVFKQISEKNLVKTEYSTKENVATTYFLVLVLGESHRVLNESLKSLEQTYTEMVQLNKQGFNEETDVAQINININNLKRLVTSVESQQDVSMKLLKYQLGMEFTQDLVLTDSINGLIMNGNIQYLSDLSYNVKNSVDYQIVDNLEKSTALMLKREQSKYLPTISAFYRRHEQTNSPSFNFAVKDLVGVAVNVPIFTSGQRNSKISQARFDLEKSQLNKDNAEQGLIMEFETALNAYQTAFNTFNTSSESISLSKKVLDKTLVKFHEGVSSSFELSQMQTQYLTAESGYYNSVLSLLNAKAKLDRILSAN